MILAFGAWGHWFESCPNLIFVSLLQTLFVRICFHLKGFDFNEVTGLYLFPATICEDGQFRCRTGTPQKKAVLGAFMFHKHMLFLTSTLHNILSKPLAAFPHNYCWNIGRERGMNPVAVTIINPWKEHRLSRVLNKRPPVLKSATLLTELSGSALWFQNCILQCCTFHRVLAQGS